ncbi:uncharacterized protein [Henckelia pumila]|uniref:uncharacterized protein n=1 Tax=Henckelia pumila TaxID=405737 RepID=UPI003C6E7A0B
MALQNDFEGLRGTILHCSPLPSVDSVVIELLAEEIRLNSKEDKGSVTPTTPAVFAAPRQSPPSNQNRPVPKVSPDECAFCKEKGHWKAQCPRLLVAAPSLDPHLVEQFQQFLASQPHVMSASSHKDSGDSHHMPHDIDSFASVNSTSSLSVMTADGTPMSLAGIGSVHTSRLSLLNDSRAQKVIETGRREGGLYVLNELKVSDVAASRVLGHLESHDISDCSGCKLAKFSALPFYKSISFSIAPFDLVHSDVWGPYPVYTKGGSRYYVFFIDDFTHYTWVYLMKCKSDFLTIFRNFKALVKTQHSSVIKFFRCNLGGEYTYNNFSQLLASDGTIHQTSCTDTPQQNGVVERKHRHLVEIARSFMLSAEVPSVYWGEAVLTASHVINRIPISHNSGLSPFEKLYGHSPDYSSLRG